MRVIIDDIEFVPLREIDTDDILEKALNIRFDSDAGENITVRQYLENLLLTLWNEKEGFSSKRPFGNSGWDYEIFEVLLKNNLIEGSIDEYGSIEKLDENSANEFVCRLISKIFEVKQ